MLHVEPEDVFDISGRVFFASHKIISASVSAFVSGSKCNPACHQKTFISIHLRIIALIALWAIIAIPTCPQKSKKINASSTGENVSASTPINPEIQRLTLERDKRKEAAERWDSWNIRFVWFAGFSALLLAISAIGVSRSNGAFNRASEDLNRAKDGQLTLDLATKDAEIKRLDNNGIDAKAAQQRVEIDLGKQQERAAKAEKDLLELKEKVKDRHLTTEQSKNLVAFLSPYTKGTITVGCLGGTPEPCSFADELIAALKASNWTVTMTGRGTMIVGGTPVGLIIQVPSSNAAYAGLLQTALTHIGLSAAGEILPGMSADVPINLFVGSKPPIE
jgi:hypothetical protein